MSKRNKVERNCKTCGGVFLAAPKGGAKYCSKRCLYTRNDTTRNCEHCGKSFRSPPSQMHVRTCSVECGYAIRDNRDRRVECLCKQCGKVFLESPSHVDRRSFCSLACRDANASRKADQAARFDGANNPNWFGGISIPTVSASGKLYHRMSHDKENARCARRRAAKLQATVAWGDPVKIDAFYAAAQRVSDELGMIYHVDHMVPLVSPLVSGLHNEFNLQLLPGPDNLRKHNRSWPGKW